MNRYIKIKKIVSTIFKILLSVIYGILGGAALLYSVVGGLVLIIYGAENVFFLLISGVIVCISWYLLFIVYIKIFYFIIPEEIKRLIEIIF